MRARSLGRISESPFPAGTAPGRNQRAPRCQHRLPAVIRTAALESTASELSQAPQGLTGPPIAAEAIPPPPPFPNPSTSVRPKSLPDGYALSQQLDPSSATHGAEPERTPLSPIPAAVRPPGPAPGRHGGGVTGRHVELGAGAAGARGGEPPTYTRTRGESAAAAPKSWERAALGRVTAWVPFRGVPSGHDALLHSSVLFSLRVTQGHAWQPNRTNNSPFPYSHGPVPGNAGCQNGWNCSFI